MKQNLPKVLIIKLLIPLLTALIVVDTVSVACGSNIVFTTSFFSTPQKVKSVSKDSVPVSEKESLSFHKTYRIQVCALYHKIKDIGLLEKGCGQNSLIAEEVDGYFKYLTADIVGYTSAIKTLNAIKMFPGFEGSFIVMYESGKRVRPLGFSKTNTDKDHATPQSKTSQPKVIKSVSAVLPAVNKSPIPASPAVQQPIAKTVQEKTKSKLASNYPVSDYKISKHSDSIEKILKPFNIEKGFIHKILSSTLILFILMSCTIGFLILVLFLIFYRFRRIRRQQEGIDLSESYVEKLAEYWSDSSADAPIPTLFKAANTNFKKDILIAEMISFLDSMEEVQGNKIRDVYFKLELNFYSFQKLSSNRWNVQSMGLHELGAMTVVQEADAVEEFINHPNPVLRHEAISSIVRLRPSDPFSFLDRMKVVFTVRDQIIAITMLRKQHFPVPIFNRWFDSYNPSVVMFAVDMACKHNQIESTEQFDKLLRHSSGEVKACVIKAIGEMHLAPYTTRLIPIFNDEHEDLQLLILQSIGKLEDPSSLNFLSDIVLFNTSMKIRMEAAKALVNTGPQGLTRLQTLLLNQDRDISYIYHQICG